MSALTEQFEKWSNMHIHGEPGYESKVRSDGQLQIYPHIVEVMGLGFRFKGPLKFYMELFSICKDHRDKTKHGLAGTITLEHDKAS